MESEPIANTSFPKYYGLRIYLSSSILYFFLVFPFLAFLAFQSVPKFMKERPPKDQEVKALADSLAISFDSIIDFNDQDVDSLVNRAIAVSENFADSLVSGKMDPDVIAPENENGEEIRVFGDDSPLSTFFLLLFLLTILSYLAGLIYNNPFKRFFKNKRAGKEVQEKLHAFCKKQLFQTPVVNALILGMPSFIIFIYSLLVIITKASFEGEAERDLFIQLLYLALVATILEFLFVFHWQKHRVHMKYIEHIYAAEELRKQIFRRRGKIRYRFLAASGMTTFLPLVIVLVYLTLSLTSLKDLELDTISQKQREILIGPLSTIINADQATFEADKYEKLFYVNAIDSMVMLVGIGNGIFVSLVYLLLFIKWASQDITRPIKELLANIINTRGGELEQFTIVRTNDEIGELAEGYNEMTKKIHDYVESISTMNRDLEKTVRERTNEVVEQKEEIEAQKEEIEAQLDLATSQKDTITRQKDQILDSIRYAERIQSAILPPIEHLSEYLTDHFILFRPRDIVSGDYYWTARQGDKIMIAVADCTGHGVPGAFLSMLGISSMNEIINRNESIKANQILELLRDFVINSLHQTGSRGETQDGIEIALCVIDTRHRVLEYAGANRPLYIIRRNEFLHIRGDKMPIGIYDQEPTPFNNHEISLELGDSIYLFSDGYVDQLGGPLRKTFRANQFRKLLLANQDHSMEGQKQILEEKLDSWRGEVEQIDDILVIGIKV